MNPIPFFFLVLASCSRPAGEPAESPPFNLSRFMRMEADQLGNENARIVKTIIWNGKSETEYLEKPQWDKELMLAQGLREDTLYWHQKFSLRKSPGKDGITYHYSALEPEFPVRDIQLKLNGEGDITSMRIFSYSATPLYETARLSLYYPGKQFSIHGFSRIRTLDPVSYHIISNIQ